MYSLVLRKLISKAVTYILAILVSLAILFPIVWLLNISLLPPQEIFTYPPKFLTEISLENYVKVLSGGMGEKYQIAATGGGTPFQVNLLNSLICAGSGSILAILLAIPAAYSLSRFRFPLANFFRYQILSFRLTPPIVVLVPLYLIYQATNLYDTHIGLVLVYILANLPLAVWLLIGFFKEVPIELEEAALIDGCTRISAVFRVVLPVASTGLISVAILSLLFTWNDFIFAFILTGNNVRTAPVALLGCISYEQIMWGQLAAQVLLTLIPIFIFVFFVQKYIIRGLTLGAIKG